MSGENLSFFQKNQLSSLIQKATEEEKPEVEQEVMERWARKATAQVFRNEEVRINAFLIEATKQKMEIANKMLKGLKLVEDRLFSPEMINSADFRGLMVMFSEVADKVLDILKSIEETRDIIVQMNVLIPELEQAGGSFKRMSENITPSMPLEQRKKLSLAYRMLMSAVHQPDEKVIPIPSAETPLIENGNSEPTSSGTEHPAPPAEVPPAN